jgi:hypothetical protein
MWSLRTASIVFVILNLAGKPALPAPEPAETLLKRTMSPEFTPKRAPESVWREGARHTLRSNHPQAKTECRTLCAMKQKPG